MKAISIRTDFIKLEQLLKLADAVSSGGEAKAMILEGRVLVNQEQELRRGRKLRDGDVVSFEDQQWKVRQTLS